MASARGPALGCTPCLPALNTLTRPSLTRPSISRPSTTRSSLTRSSPAWLLIAFLIAFLGVGFRYWQLAYAQVSLPESLQGPGLVAVGVVAMLARAFGLARFHKVWLSIAASVPCAVLLRILVESNSHPGTHDLWPLDLAIAAGAGLACALAGTLLGSLFLLRSSKRPD